MSKNLQIGLHGRLLAGFIACAAITAIAAGVGIW